MKFATCQTCDSQVSFRAPACPRCGEPLRFVEDTEAALRSAIRQYLADDPSCQTGFWIFGEPRIRSFESKYPILTERLLQAAMRWTLDRSREEIDAIQQGREEHRGTIWQEIREQVDAKEKAARGNDDAPGEDEPQEPGPSFVLFDALESVLRVVRVPS